MKSDMHTLFGGWDKMAGAPKSITVSGGFTCKNKHLEHNVVIGDITKHFVKNKIIEWDTFKSTYYKNDKLDQKHYPQFLNVLNNIYPLPIYTTDENELLFLISNIYKAQPLEIINALLKSVNIYQPLKSSIRHLFMIYKVYIEKMIEIYVDLRNQYINKFKLQKNNELNDFDELVTRWNIIDDENQVNTSSITLFFNFHPSNVNFAKTIPKIIWKIKSKDTKHDNINKLVTTFLNEIKSENFEYVGYCPHADIKRFQLLLKFPIKSLIDLIKSIDYGNKYSNINNTCKKIIKKVIDLDPKVNRINNAIKSNIVIKRLKVKDIQKFAKREKIQQKIACYEKYVDAFLKLYKDIIPHLIKKEKYINELAISINLIACDLQNFTNSFNHKKHIKLIE
jgi:hypothetical protein